MAFPQRVLFAPPHGSQGRTSCPRWDLRRQDLGESLAPVQTAAVSSPLGGSSTRDPEKPRIQHAFGEGPREGSGTRCFRGVHPHSGRGVGIDAPVRITLLCRLRLKSRGSGEAFRSYADGADPHERTEVGTPQLAEDRPRPRLYCVRPRLRRGDHCVETSPFKGDVDEVTPSVGYCRTSRCSFEPPEPTVRSTNPPSTSSPRASRIVTAAYGRALSTVLCATGSGCPASHSATRDLTASLRLRSSA
jgi:hypothetical protein